MAQRRINSGIRVLVPLAELEGESELELAFETKELREICENEAEARRRLGNAVAEALKHRLADLDAATSPRDLIGGKPRLGPDARTMTLDLCEGCHVVFTHNHPNNPTKSTGEVDWEKVSRVRILRIERKHA